MTDAPADPRRLAWELHKARNEVARLKYQLKTMRQDLRKERAEHRQTMLKLELSEAWGRGPIGVPGKNSGS